MLSTRRRVDPGRDNPGSTRDWPVRNPVSLRSIRRATFALRSPSRAVQRQQVDTVWLSVTMPHRCRDLFFELETQRDEHQAGLPDWPVFALSWTAVQVGAIIAFQATPMRA